MSLERWTYVVRLRLRSIFRRGRIEEELAEEIQDHLAREAGEQMARGLPPDAARGEALRRFGGVEQIKERSRDVHHVRLLHDLLQDLRYAARVLRRSPGFTAVAVLSLTLGIGANSAIVRLLDAVRLRTLPVAAPFELALVRVANRAWNGEFSGRYAEMTYPQWERLRASQQSFSGLAAWSEATFDLATRGKSRFAENALWVSGDFFNVLGVRPALGRVLTAADDVKGCGAPRVVLSHAFWLREFGGDRSVLAKSLAINGHRLDVVGVTEAGFFGVEVGRSFDFAVPLCADGLINGDANRLERRSSWWLGVMGRLKDGWSLAQADAHLASLSPALFRDTLPAGWSPQDTADYLGFKLGAFPGAAGVSRLRQEYDTPLALLLALAGIVLLIACANLANLLLARGGAREREMAVRLALGASRARLMRQLLTESLLLASIGAVLSGWIAYAFGLAMVQTISSPVSPLFVDLSTNWRLVAFTAALAVLTCILFGIMPALRAAGIAPGESMKGGSRQQAADAPRATLRRGLVAAEVALSLLLLVGGLLFARSLFNLLTLDAGFRQEGILEADVDLTRLDLPSAGLRVFRRELIDRVRAIPGVDAAASASSVPLVGNWWRTIYADAVERERLGSSRANRIGPGYFETMGIAVRAGRDFERSRHTFVADRRNRQRRLCEVLREGGASRVDDPVRGAERAAGRRRADRGPREQHEAQQPPRGVRTDRLPGRITADAAGSVRPDPHPVGSRDGYADARRQPHARRRTRAHRVPFSRLPGADPVFASARPPYGRALRVFRRPCRRAGHGRRVRRHFLLGRTTDARDRHPSRARRRPRGHPAAGAPRGGGSPRRRSRARHAADVDLHADGARSSVRASAG
jgi:predicted permease